MQQNNTNSSSVVAAPTMQQYSLPPVVHEVVRPTSTQVIQPVIHRQVETTEIHQITQPIYEKTVLPTQYQDSQGVKQYAPGPYSSLAGSASQPTTTETFVKPAIVHEYVRPVYIQETQPQSFIIPPGQGYQQISTCTCAPQQQLPTTGRRRFGRKQGHNGSTIGTQPTSGLSAANTNTDAQILGASDVTHHSYRWAHRDRNLSTNATYGGAPPAGVVVGKNSTGTGTSFSHGPSCPLYSNQSNLPLTTTQTIVTPTSGGQQIVTEQQSVAQPGFGQQSFGQGLGQSGFNQGIGQQGFSQQQVPYGFTQQTTQSGFSQQTTQPGYTQQAFIPGQQPTGLAGSGSGLGSGYNAIGPVSSQKRHHPIETLFGRKHHDSGGHVGMLGSGPTGGVGLPSQNNVDPSFGMNTGLAGNNNIGPTTISTTTSTVQPTPQNYL